MRRMTMKLKPCPFCGNTKPEMDWNVNIGVKDYNVECEHCGAKGPEHEVEKAAVEAWNTRAEYPNCHGSVDGWCTEIRGDNDEA
jgi:Lar family restriction alleviation protein